MVKLRSGVNPGPVRCPAPERYRPLAARKRESNPPPRLYAISGYHFRVACQPLCSASSLQTGGAIGRLGEPSTHDQRIA